MAQAKHYRIKFGASDYSISIFLKRFKVLKANSSRDVGVSQMKTESKFRKLKVTTKQAHADCATCIGWAGNNELLTFGDDRQILRFTADSEPLSPFQTALFDQKNQQGEQASPLFATEVDWFPLVGKAQASSEVFAVGGTDGLFKS